MSIVMLNKILKQNLKTGLCFMAFFSPYFIFHNEITSKYLSNSPVSYREKVTLINWTQTHYQMLKISRVESFQVRKDIVSEGGCHLPDLDPWDPSIVEYVKDFPEVKNKYINWYNYQLSARSDV